MYKNNFLFLFKRQIIIFFLKKIDVKNMNPRLGSACHLIVYAFMQQCDDVETIHQSVLKNLYYGNYICDTSI